MRDASVPPLPPRLLSWTATAAGERVPGWLSDRDRPWLRDLIAAAGAAVGAPYAAFAARLRRWPADPRAEGRDRPARHVLLALLRPRGPASAGTARRLQLFTAAAAAPAAPAPPDFDPYADLPGERAIAAPSPPLEPWRLALQTNLAHVQGWLRTAEVAELQLQGAARLVLRTAWLLGAGLEVVTADAAGSRLRWRRDPARPRGWRALAALLPLLPWTAAFRLRAACALAGARGELVVATGDPLWPAPEPRPHDSALEARFAADFARAAPSWRLLREPAPLRCGPGLAFPDFLLQRGDDPPWWCELAGLRDRAALPPKLALLDAAPRLLVCLPAGAIPAARRGEPRLVPFRRRVDPLAVLAAIAAAGGDGRP